MLKNMRDEKKTENSILHSIAIYPLRYESFIKEMQ